MATKDPAFLFYPGDWLGGTLGMTLEEKGAYMEILMLQFNRGHMDGHMVGQVVGQIWDKIKHKFEQDQEGKWFNARLELEVNRRKEFTNSRKNNLKGKNQYSKKEGQVGGHMTTHMENENKDINNTIKGVDIFFKDLPNSVLFENITRDLNFTKEKLNSFVPKFRLACKTEYPNFPEFANHFKNWVRKESANEKPTIKRTGLV